MIKKLHGFNAPSQAAASETKLEYCAPKPRSGERLARNLALAGMLLITISAVRNAELPSGQTVLTAVQDIIETDWDENLGKISFVSNLFPETVSVFFQNTPDSALLAPCLGQLTHAWTENEPYLGYASAADQRVYAIAEGQVMSIAHGMNEEKIIRVRQKDGLETLYYNLADIFVQEGDPVDAACCLGFGIPEQPVVIEVRREGLSIDPSAWMQERSAAL